MTASTRDIVLSVEGLKTWFHSRDGIAKSVDGVTFDLARGETLAIVGESGSGKSVTSLSIMGLLPKPAGRIEGGRILFRDRQGAQHDLAQASPATLRRIRGAEIAMIFQEPMTSLNPLYTVGDQITKADPMPRRSGAPATCWNAWRSRPPTAASTNTRTRCREACGSA
jgi:peptide/nickel transport system ATP-binding protein